MKALSIRQPWAWLIVTGQKDIENRTWRTHYRGRFLVHAGRRFDAEGYERVVSTMGLALPDKSEFKRGGIIGEVELVDCVDDSDSPWFEGPYGFVLSNPRLRRFRPVAGRLKFFDV